ncbi:MAG: rRNA adenine N(6)-methyltransferase family protein [Dehalococcoidia bacterium]
MSAAGPRRRAEFSQHFLRSRALARTLVDCMDIVPSDLVVEVGPGRGALTEHLAARVARAGRVVAIEVDPDLARAARARFEGVPSVEVVTGDFLRFEIPRGARVVANLPFGITAAALRHVTASSAADAHLIVQREAAMKFAGSPWGAESMASLALKPWWHIEVLRALRPTDFDPPPAVDAVLLWLARRDPPLLPDREREGYRRFLDGTVGRGRTLADVLGRIFTRAQVERLRRDLRLDLRGAPSDASFDRWLAVYRASRALERTPPPRSAPRRSRSG